MHPGSTAIGYELIGQAFCLVFHAYHFDPGIDMCASFSTMMAMRQGHYRADSPEPDAEERSAPTSNMSDPVGQHQFEDDHDDDDGEESGDEEPPEIDPDDVGGPGGGSSFDNIVYRPNLYNREQRAFCFTAHPLVGTDANLAADLAQCWLSHRGPMRLSIVNPSVLGTFSSRRALTVGIVEYVQDGRSLHSESRVVLLEIQHIYQEEWIQVTTTSRFATRRTSFRRLLLATEPALNCETETVRCYGFQNGQLRPMEVLLSLGEGDYLQVQIHHDDEPPDSCCYILDETPRSVVSHHPMAPAIRSSDGACQPTSKVLVQRPWIAGHARLPAFTFHEDPDDDYLQYRSIFSRIWDDLRTTDWEIVWVDESFRSSQHLSAWDKIYLLDHEEERHVGYSLILTEINADTDTHTLPIVRALWIVPVLSQQMLLASIDITLRCQMAGVLCDVFHNGVHVEESATVTLQHGDFVRLTMTSSSLIVANHANCNSKYVDDGSMSRYMEVVWVVLMDLCVFAFLCILMVLWDRPCPRRLKKIGGQRYSVRLRPGRTRKTFWYVAMAGLLLSADAMPVANFIAQAGQVESGINIDGAFPADIDVPLRLGFNEARNEQPTDQEPPVPIVLQPQRLPQNLQEAQLNRAPRASIVNEPGIMQALQHHIEEEAGDFVVDTYGLYDGPIGTRSQRVDQLHPRGLLRVIVRMWVDYSSHFDTRIYLVQPQPPTRDRTLHVTFVVRFVDHFLPLPDPIRAVLVDQVLGDGEAQGVTTIRAASFLLPQSSVIDVFRAVRTDQSCFPNGIRPCHVQWRGREWVYPDALHTNDGDYLIVRIGSLAQYFVNTDFFFNGARRFALDGHRVFVAMNRASRLALWVHAVDEANRALGYRVMVLPIEDLLQPERVWNRAKELWRDYGPGRFAKLINVLPQPSTLSVGAPRLHIIFSFKAFPGLLPILFMAKLYQYTTTTHGQELQWKAVHCLSEATAAELIRCSGLHQFEGITQASVNLYQHPSDLDASATPVIAPGAFLQVSVYVASTFETLRRLWSHIDAGDPSGAHGLSFLQRSTRLQRIHDSFDRLPPPGNGTTVVDLRRDLDSLDDWSQHDWGWCLFDAGGCSTSPSPSISIPMPCFGDLCEQLHALPDESLPLSILHDNLDFFDEELKPIIAALHTEPHDDPQVIQIYTDGSHDSSDKGDNTVGWGFVAFTCGSTGITLRYMACGYILDDLCPVLHGHPVELSARTGEIEALIQATLWTLASCENRAFELYYDAITVGHGGLGQWNFKQTDTHARILRALVQYAQCFQEQGFLGRHVKAHDGILGNEIANFLAQFARTKQVCAGASKVALGNYVVGDRMPLEWLWTRHIPISDNVMAYPAFQDGLLSAESLIPTNTVEEALPKLLTSNAAVDSCILHSDFGLATYNVGTVNMTDEVPYDGALRSHEYLRQQAHSHGIDCLFLQETRARTSNMISSGTHIRLVSACNTKKGGTEIWLRKRRNNGADSGLRPQDILVLASDPEYICARVKWSYGRFLLLSAHAPHSGWAAADVEQWWQQLSHLITRFHHDADEWLIVGIDANAHFDGEDRPWIGPLGATPKSNVPAKHFGDFLKQHNLFLPSTYDDYHSGPCFTWRVNSDQPGARCDYVCLPMAWRTFSPRSQNLPELDAGTASFDHTPVGVWCALSFTKTRRKRPRFDVTKIVTALDKDGMQLREKLFAIPWQQDVHQHAAGLSDIISDWLAEQCPPDKRGPRAAYITKRSWDLRGIRLWLARSVRHIHDCYRQHQLRTALYAWFEGVPRIEVGDRGFHVTYMIVRQRRLLLQALADTRLLLKRHLRHDRTLYLEKVVDEAMLDHPNALHRHLRSIGVMGKNKRGAIQPLPCLRDMDGNLVTTFSEWAEVWRKQFEQQEDGIARTRSELFDACLSRQTWDASTCTPPTWQQLPTLQKLESVLRQTCSGKAFFDDLIPGEVLHYGAGTLAPAIYPLMLKQWIFNREPLVFKGGLLVSAFKKGNPMDPTNYRSLLISPCLGKAFHRILRRDLMGVFEPHSLPLQLGGRPKIAVTQAAHSLHLFLHEQRCEQRSCAVLFLDIRNAFYRLFRQQLTNTGVLMRSVEELFASLQLPPEAYQDFCVHLQGTTATEDIGTAPFLENQVREVLNTTWFVVSGSDTFTEARKGSRPGDSIADLLFTIAFRHILARVKNELAACGVLTTLRWNGARAPFGSSVDGALLYDFEVLGPVWADDLAVLLSDSSPVQLLDNVRRVAGKLFDTLLLSGMQPNLGPSKTELLLELRGPKCTPLRKQIAFDDFLLTTESQYLLQPLRVVGAYRHLGTWVQINGKIGKDLSCKVAMGHSTITKYRASIFSNKAMHLERKVQLFHSLILSAVLFNSPIWMLTRKRDVQKLHSGVMSLYRRVAIGHWGIVTRGWRDETIQSRLSLPNPLELLHTQRLRYLQHLVRAGDQFLWAMLQQRDYWWKLVDLSLEWLRNNVTRPLPTTSCMEDWQQWQPLLQRPGRGWNNLLKKALLHATLQNRKRTSWIDFHHELCRTAVESGRFTTPTVEQSWEMHACPLCRQTFTTNAGWSVHAFRKHGRVTPARQFASGTTCEFCLKKFHDHMGLVNHVGNSAKCFWQYQSRGQRVAQQPSLNSRAEIRSRTELRCPVYKIDGPVPIPLPLHDPQPSQEQQMLLDSWYVVRGQFPPPTLEVSAIREALRLATLETTLPVFEILYVARSWRLQLQRGHQWDEDDGFAVALNKYINDFSIPWLFADATVPDKPIEDPVTVLDHWTLHGSGNVIVPRPISYRQIMIAHLFSGRRRSGDFQEWASQTSFQDGKFTTLPLSVDIIFSERWGNLLNPATAALFYDAIRSGLLVAVLAGPPCETWSIARQRGLYLDDGPRPLRSLEQLAGFSLLTIREVRQLCLGNELLGIALQIALLLWLCGGLCLLEHPSEPAHPTAPSIWRTVACLFLLGQSGNRKLKIYQGNFGAKSPKPTEFLVTHCPADVERIFHRHWTVARLPMAVSIGKNAKGRYNTASLKEYPPALSRALWSIAESHIQSRGFVESPQTLSGGRSH